MLEEEEEKAEVLLIVLDDVAGEELVELVAEVSLDISELVDGMTSLGSELDSALDRVDIDEDDTGTLELEDSLLDSVHS